jgi:hypothetical protein
MLFGLMAFTMLYFSIAILNLTMPVITGYSLRAIQAFTKENVDDLRLPVMLAQLITAAGLFLIPPLVFSYWSHPSMKKYLRLYVPKLSHVVLAICMLMGALPLFLEIGIFLRNLVPGIADGAKKVELLLNISKPLELVVMILVMAVMPGVSEELFFRGVLLRFAHQRIRKAMLSAIITSILFAIAHDSIYNIPSITIAGVLLCYTYYWSGSLITGMIAHVIYNASQIYFSYLTVTHVEFKGISTSEHLPWYVIVGGTVISILSAYTFWKTRKPLSPDWSANFTPEEIQAKNEHI